MSEDQTDIVYYRLKFVHDITTILYGQYIRI